MAASSNLVIAIRAVDEATRTLGAVSRSIGGVGGALGDMAKIAGGVALTQLPGALLDMAQSASDDEAATLRLHKSLKNMGGDFDKHLKQVNEAIDAGQKLAFSDDDVRDSFQFLAAATGDTDEALRRQKAAMDLARGASIPLETATKMLGKLNEENVEVFKKMGIVMGDNATEADVLAAVQKKFGDQASTYAKSTAGQFEQAKLALSETQEAIGNALLPVLTKVGTVLAEALPTLQAWVGSLAEMVGPLIQSGLESLQPFVDVLSTLGQYLGAVVEDGDFLNDWLMDLPGPLQPITKLLGEVVALFGKFGEAIGQLVSGDTEGAMDTVAGAFQKLGPKILATLGVVAGQIVDWVTGAAIPAVAGAFADGAIAFVGWIGDALPKALAALSQFLVGLLDGIGRGGSDMSESTGSQWTAAVVDWIVNDALPALAVALPKIGAALVQFTLDVAPALGGAILRLVELFWTWVANDALPMLQRELPKVGAQLAAWLTDEAIPWAAENLPKLGAQLIKGIVAGLGTGWNDVLKPWLLGLMSGEGSAQGEAGNSIVATLQMLNPLALLAKLGGMVLQGFIDGLSDKWGGAEGAKAWFQGLPAKALEAIGDVTTLLFAAGKGILQSLIDGMAAQVQGLFTWIRTNITDQIPSFIRDLLGIESPSTVMFDVGQNLVLGLTKGMQSKLGDIDDVVGGLIGRALGVAEASGDIAGFIRATAAKYGIDPNVALAVAMSEGGVGSWTRPGDFNTNGVPSSFGPFQMHYGGLGEPHSASGLGDAFTAATGIRPGDPGFGPASVDYALRMAAAGGWGPWHGWTGAPFAGIHGMAKGGMIKEPIYGIGASGKRYAFGEKGPEVVTPMGRFTQGPGGSWLQNGKAIVQEMVTPLGRFQKLANGTWQKVVTVAMGGGPPAGPRAPVLPSLSLGGGPPGAATAPKSTVIEQVKAIANAVWGTDQTDAQFGGVWNQGWDPAAIYAACGAVAAAGFARHYGKNVDTGDLLRRAEAGGFWDRGGWHGPNEWMRFMSQVVGIPVGATDLNGAIATLADQKPVAISSPRWFHYFLGQGWDGRRMFVGNTGANALKAGAPWMSPGEIGGGTYIRALAKGGWLTEPVAGIGMRSGMGYALAERGPEYVSPAGKMGGDVYVSVRLGEHEFRDVQVKTLDRAQRAGQFRAVTR